MTKIDDGGHAFPQGTAAGVVSVHKGGMSLRDWFAGQALAGMAELSFGSAFEPSSAARAAFVYADAMIAARKGGEE